MLFHNYFSKKNFRSPIKNYPYNVHFCCLYLSYFLFCQKLQEMMKLFRFEYFPFENYCLYNKINHNLVQFMTEESRRGPTFFYQEIFGLLF